MSFSDKFKENWNKEDELCPNCHNVAKRAVGINRQNIKRLLSFKANANDFLTLVMIAMVVLAALDYNDMKNKNEVCQSELGKYTGQHLQATPGLAQQYNPLSNLNLTGLNTTA